MSYRDTRVMSQDAMYHAIYERVAEANERNEHIVLERFPLASMIDEPIIMGSFSWTLTVSRQRLINAKHACYVLGLPCTPADLARHYLAVKFPRVDKNGKQSKRSVLRCRAEQYQAFKRGIAHPLYADPCRLDMAAYVDIQSAYWSILKVVGWNVEYMPPTPTKNGLLGVGASMLDFPFAGNKLARNCLVSVGIGKGMRIYHKGKFTVKNIGNPYQNRGLWHLEQDVLNSIAWECVQAGAVYVNTDGYIFPHERLEEGLQIIQSWGLPYRIKHVGAARVFGTGAYDIGSHVHKSKALSRYRFSSMRPSYDAAWLKRKFSFFAARLNEPELPDALSPEAIANFILYGE